MDHYFTTFANKTKTHPIEVRFLLIQDKTLERKHGNHP